MEVGGHTINTVPCPGSMIPCRNVQMPNKSQFFMNLPKVPSPDSRSSLHMGTSQSTPSCGRTKSSHRSSYSSSYSANTPLPYELKPHPENQGERAPTPIRMGYPFYEEVAREADLKREKGKRRRSLNMLKTLAGHGGRGRFVIA